MMTHDRVIRTGGRRRAFVRYRLSLPVIFRWNDGGSQIEGGFTRDVGAHGAQIMSGRCPPAGAEVHLELLLPPIDEDPGAIRIHGVGRVVQVTRIPGATCFGVHGSFHEPPGAPSGLETGGNHEAQEQSRPSWTTWRGAGR